MVDRPDSPQGEQRADSVGTSMGGSSIASALSGLGTVNSKGASGAINWSRRALSWDEAGWLWRFNGLARKIVARPVQTAFRAGWSLVDSSDVAAEVDQWMQTARASHKLSRGMIYGRLQGRAGTWMVVDDGLDPSEPLDLSRVRRLRNLVTLQRQNITPIRYVTDPEDPRCGLPYDYWITIPGGRSVRVHGSRVLLWRGADTLPEQYQSNGGADDSVLDPCWDKLAILDLVDSAGGTVVQEGSYSVVRVPGLANVTTAHDAAQFLAALRRIMRAKSLINGWLIGEGEEVTQNSISITGFKDIAQNAKEGLAAASGQPLPLLMGTSPAGLNADTSWLRAWADYVEGEVVELGLLPQLEQLYEVVLSAKDGPTGGRIPESWTIRPNPVIPETRAERTDRQAKQMQTAAIAIQAGVLDPLTVRDAFFGPEGWQDEIIVSEPEPGPTEAEILAAITRADEAPKMAIPKAARDAAAKAIRWREEHGSEVDAMTETGWRRARQLATSETVTLDTARTIRAWFARHEDNRKIAPEDEGKPWRDSGYVAWEGWGGDAMRRAVDAFVGRHEDEG